MDMCMDREIGMFTDMWIDMDRHVYSNGSQPPIMHSIHGFVCVAFAHAAANAGMHASCRVQDLRPPQG